MAVAAKKAKVTFQHLNGELQNPDVVDQFRKQYTTAKPYPHAVIPKLCTLEAITSVRDELVTQLETKFKETDLFKLYQTTDLANIDANHPELSKSLPNLLALRDELYSPEFRSIVASITGCKELTERVDMAASAYAEGCHLLCHDDVIGTRAVSFIIYFSAEDWSKKDGGALELYDVEPSSVVKNDDPNLPAVQGVPEPYPSAAHLPLFNHMAFFRVEPGRSFHSVQEVLRTGSPRLSIQGWYHGPEPPAGGEMASLNQLKGVKDYSNTFSPLDVVRPETPMLNSSDKEVLAQFLNPTYLQAESLKAMQERFENDSSIQLRSFLNDNLAEILQKQTTQADCDQNLWGVCIPQADVGITEGWTSIGPAHMQRYLEFQGIGANGVPATVGQRLAHLKQQLFSSDAFGRWLSIVSSGKITGVRCRVRRFRPGMDYTVAHHGLLEDDYRLDATLCFVKSDEEIEKADWEQGDVGGFECYIAAENEENVAAEVYCDDDASGNDLLSVSASSNTLNIVLRDPGTMRFIKYVSGRAPGSRWDISCVYRVEYEDSDDENEVGE